jgi:hypothetical protein
MAWLARVLALESGESVDGGVMAFEYIGTSSLLIQVSALFFHFFFDALTNAIFHRRTTSDGDWFIIAI